MDPKLMAMMGQGGQGAALAPEPSPDADATQTVPLAWLAQPDDTDTMQTPGVGDSGTMQVDYIIQSVQGDNAIISRKAINGNSLGGDENQEAPDADAQEGQDLQGMAQQMDGQP